ncbi:hypothetical protein P8452_02944 [Trifolium repens]|nr:hypothetical protein P8452_02944 [Trifolium repens]
MEAAVKALDEQKVELEKVITALKQEEAEEEGLIAENDGVHDAGDGVDAADVTNIIKFSLVHKVTKHNQLFRSLYGDG